MPNIFGAPFLPFRIGNCLFNIENLFFIIKTLALLGQLGPGTIEQGIAR